MENKNAREIALEKRLMSVINCSEPKLTRQSDKKMSDINNILKKYSKDGVLPSTREHLARYIDNTQIPSLEDAHQVISEAKTLFMQLPAHVRKLMDNDPSKMEEVCKDPKYQELLVKEGILDKIKVEVQQGSGAESSTSPKPENPPKAESEA